MKKLNWPVLVTGNTTDWNGKRKRFCRYEEGAGDIEKAMLKAVLSQPHPSAYLGTEITGVTLLGQVCKRIVCVHFGEYSLSR